MIFFVFASLCQFSPVFAGINRHKLVFATDWHKLSLRRHFANPDMLTSSNTKSFFNKVTFSMGKSLCRTL